MHQHLHNYDTYQQIRIGLALAITVAYLLTPIVARKLPMTRPARIAGTAFFSTCAITHFHHAFNPTGPAWMLAVDTLQLAGLIVFMSSLNRQFDWALRRHQRTPPSEPAGHRRR